MQIRNFKKASDIEPQKNKRRGQCPDLQGERGNTHCGLALDPEYCERFKVTPRIVPCTGQFKEGCEHWIRNKVKRKINLA